jgi:hypothetical protein
MKWAFVLVAVLASMGGTVPMTDPQSPAASRLSSFIPVTAGPWLSEADQVFDADSIFDYIDGAGEVYRSYNMELIVARRFHKDGRPDIVVDAFDMGSAEDAFGVFTHDLDGEEAGIGQGSVYKAGLLSFWQDRYFLSVYAEEETPESKAAVLDLGRGIAAAIPGRGEPPGLLGLLPGEGLERRKVRFFHSQAILNYHYFVAAENILGLGPETDVVLATYGGGAGRSLLLVAGYKDGTAAARAAESFRGAYLPEAGAEGAVETENGRWSAVRAAGRYVAVVFDAGSGEEAESRLDAVAAAVKRAKTPPP